MMGLSFLGPILASVLYVIVFQKAGFRGAILAVCAGPLLGALAGFVMGRVAYAGGGMPMSFAAIILISLRRCCITLVAKDSLRESKRLDR
ncbi:hypothetical protein, partial [Frigidibacter sp. SD6-1]|uniref:hypothetical protein n=1 Tax=Frigidibacter sp. SD6-1 TaxID=3032581 RepID=UPI0024E00DDB